MKRKGWVCGLLAALVLVSAQPVFAEPLPAASEQSHVFELDIGIDPNAYRGLISEKPYDDGNKNRYDVYVSENGNDCSRCTVNIRGSSSRWIGLATKTKRIPLELNFDGKGAAVAGFQNKSVKLINSFTAFRLFSEYLALDLFESCGIPTPKHRFAFLRLNGVDFGTYIAVEDLNSDFLKKHFSSTAGSLYKASNKGVPETAFSNTKWFGEIFAKKDKGDDTLLALLRALDAGEGYEQYLDMDEVLRYFACTALTGGAATILTEQNNFALYNNDGQFVLIPWDLSEAFDPFSYRGTRNGVDQFYLLGSQDEVSPLFDLIMQNPNYQAQYHAYVREFNDRFLSPEMTRRAVTAMIEELKPYLQRDVTIYMNPKDPETFLTSGNKLYGYNLLLTLQIINEQIQEQLDQVSATFYIPKGYTSLDTSSYTLDQALDFMETQSEGIHPSVKTKIIKAYAAWCNQHRVTSLQAKTGALEFGLLAALAAIGLLLPLIGVQNAQKRQKKKPKKGTGQKSKKKRKKKKAH